MLSRMLLSLCNCGLADLASEAGVKHPREYLTCNRWLPSRTDDYPHQRTHVTSEPAPWSVENSLLDGSNAGAACQRRRWVRHAMPPLDELFALACSAGCRLLGFTWDIHSPGRCRTFHEFAIENLQTPSHRCIISARRNRAALAGCYSAPAHLGEGGVLSEEHA